MDLASWHSFTHEPVFADKESIEWYCEFAGKPETSLDGFVDLQGQQLPASSHGRGRHTAPQQKVPPVVSLKSHRPGEGSASSRLFVSGGQALVQATPSPTEFVSALKQNKQTVEAITYRTLLRRSICSSVCGFRQVCRLVDFQAHTACGMPCRTSNVAARFGFGPVRV